MNVATNIMSSVTASTVAMLASYPFDSSRCVCFVYHHDGIRDRREKKDLISLAPTGSIGRGLKEASTASGMASSSHFSPHLPTTDHLALL